jgi:hypothetical protein
MMEREISDDEIIELAALQRRVDQLSLPEDIAKFEHALSQLSRQDVPILMLACKLSERKPYSVTSDNPESIRRCRLFAQHVGASVQSVQESEGTTAIVFTPPLCH